MAGAAQGNCATSDPGGRDADRTRRYAEELVALTPDVILVTGASQVPALLKATRTVPVVFVNVVDPVGAGFVDSLARPGGKPAIALMNSRRLIASPRLGQAS